MTLESLYSAVVNEKPIGIKPAPSELVRYRTLSRNDKSLMEKNGFFNQDFIKDYLDDKWQAELHNKDTFFWLYETYKIENDLKKKASLVVRMTQFKEMIMGNQNPFPALMINFNDYPFDQNEGLKKADWND